MPSQRQFYGLVFLLLSITGTARPQLLSWIRLHPSRKTEKAKKTRPVRPSPASSLVHTQAHLMYGGKEFAPVDSASAVLYNDTGPTAREDVDAIASGAQGIQQADRVCGAFVPGIPHAVGPGGDIYFDYVSRGNYWILVCAKVKFSGMAKPVWVSGTVPISREQFTEDHSAELNLPREIQIVLDPYAQELKATPVELSKLTVEQPVDFPLPLAAKAVPK